MTGYSGDAGDALAAAKHPEWCADGKMFSTPDSDNDIHPTTNCGKRSGWWLGKCGTSKLNNGDNQIYGMWVTGNPMFDVQFSRMLVKRY